jgi:hypothetical protein
VNREDRFVMSHRPYAVDLSSWKRGELNPRHTGEGDPYLHQHQTIDAIWFRRKKGVTVAHLGMLWDFSEADNAADFLRLHNDGRYGGNWIAAWDGERCWTQNPAPKTDLDRYAETLDAALTGLLNDKATPEGYDDGWWTFR